MLFIGEFSDRNDNVWHIEIYNPNVSGTTKELKFSGDPLTINMEGDLFKPVRYSSATIRILTVGFDYMNLYSPTANVDVTINRNGSEYWRGVVTPNVYDMGLDANTELIEVECIDYLSRLQYYKWGQYRNSELRNPTVTTFYDILDRILNRYTFYGLLYYPECFKDTNGNIIRLTDLSVNTHTFFKDEAVISDTEVDLEECWSLQEVVEEICNYLNVTLTTYGHYLVMIPQSKISTTYTLYNFEGSVDLYGRTIHTFTDIDKYYTSSSISLTESWNSATVNIEKQEIENLYPDLFDDSSLINACTSQHNWGDKYTYYIDDLDDRTDAYSVNKTSWKRLGYPYTKSNNGYDFVGNYKFFTNKNYNLYAYDNDGNSITYPDVINFDTLFNTMGAFFCKCSIEKFNSDGVGDFDDTSVASLNNQLIITNMFNSTRIINPSTGEVISFDIPKYPTTNKLLMQTKVGISPKIYLKPESQYISLQGSMIVPNGWRYFNDQAIGTRGIANKDAYIKCKLKWGNYYFTNMDSNGNFQRQGRWTTTNSFFKLQFKANDGKTGSKFDIVKTGGDEAFKQWEISENGYIIPLSSNLDFSQSPIFEIYSKSTADTFNDNSYLVGIIIDNLDFKIGTYKPITMTDKVFDSDTEYTNVIDESYTADGSTMTCKINTYDNKKPSYTTVLYKGNFLDNIRSTIDTTQSECRFEEWKLLQYIKQYKSPRKILTIPFNGMPNVMSVYSINKLFTNTNFILNSYELDVKNNRTNLNLIQIWNL